MATTEPHATGVRPEDLKPLLDSRHGPRRHQIRAILARPEFGRAFDREGQNAARAHIERVILAIRLS